MVWLQVDLVERLTAVDLVAWLTEATSFATASLTQLTETTPFAHSAPIDPWTYSRQS